MMGDYWHQILFYLAVLLQQTAFLKLVLCLAKSETIFLHVTFHFNCPNVIYSC